MRSEPTDTKRAIVARALTFAPKTSSEIAKEVGLPDHVAGEILTKLKLYGRARSTGWQKLPDGRRVLGWVTPDAPAVGDLVRLHAGSLASMRLMGGVK